MAYETSGSLTTDERETSDEVSWDTQTEWEAYQSATNVDITDGVVSLDTTSTIPDSVASHMDLAYMMDEGSGTTLSDSLDTGVSGTLDGAGWATDTGSPGDSDEVTTYDGVDDLGYSSSSYTGANGTTVSGAIWINIASYDDFAEIFYGGDVQGDGSNMSNGWRLAPDDGAVNLRLWHHSGGSTSSTGAISGTDITSGWIFIGYAANGDSANLYIWDTNGQQATESFTAARGTGSGYINWAGDTVGQFTESDVAMVMTSESELSESQFQEIYDDTKPSA